MKTGYRSIINKINYSISLELAIFIFIIFVGVILRFVNLGQKSLWFDEAILWFETIHPFPVMIKLMNVYASIPFMFPLLIKLTGYISMVEFALRFVSFSFGISSIILMYFLCREFLKKIPSCIGALLVSLSTLQVVQSQELRPYAMLMFLSLALLVSFIKYFKYRKNLYLFYFLIIGLISIFSHYILWFFLLIFNLMIGAEIIKRKFTKDNILKWFVIQNIFVFSLILVWNINLKSQIEMKHSNPAMYSHINEGYPKSTNPKDIANFLINNTRKMCISFYGNGGIDIFVLLLLFTLGISHIYINKSKRLILYIFGCLIIMNIFLAIFRIFPYFWGKYAIHISPFYYFFIASAFNINYTKGKIFAAISIFLIAYLVNIELYNDFKYLLNPGREESRDTINYLNANLKREEKIYINQGGFYAFVYYFRSGLQKVNVGRFWGGVVDAPFHKVIYSEVEKSFLRENKGWVFLSLFDEVDSFIRILSDRWKIERWITNVNQDVNLFYISRK
ncbi:MAG: glycosyltransferase family 39 protein [Candidatus Omnitrophica bacterium]|nr:glycosyltransferase family 39 protein [Candidatus Omnitrophota bacterium]